MSHIYRLAEAALDAGGRADGYVAIAEETAAVHARWAGDTLTANGSTHHRRLTVIATVSSAAGTAVGAVSRAGALDEDTSRTLGAAAEVAARHAEPAEDAEPLLTGDGHGDGGWAEPAAAITTGQLSSLAPLMERARAPGRHLFGYAEHRLHTVCLASSTGLRMRHTQPSAVADVTATSADHSASAWAADTAADLTGFAGVSLTAQLAERLDWARRHIELSAGRYEVLLSPSCVADLMLHLYMAAGAKDALDGRSAFYDPRRGTRIGERLTDADLTLRSDPGDPGLRCAPFVVARDSSGVFTRVSVGTESVFDNGVRLLPTIWISDGVLTALVQTRHTAARTGQPVTPRIGNLILEGKREGPSLKEMITSTKRGLLVTSLWYLREVEARTMLLTGLTRDGVYLVEDGEVIGAVNNFRFDESPLSVMARVSEIGSTEPTLPREWSDHSARVAMPALRVEGFNMSAVSAA